MDQPLSLTTPEAGYSGPDGFSFTVTDDGAAGATANLTSGAGTVSLVVRASNHVPVAADDSYSTGGSKGVGSLYLDRTTMPRSSPTISPARSRA